VLEVSNWESFTLGISTLIIVGIIAALMRIERRREWSRELDRRLWEEIDRRDDVH
jgi:hypothetical protein